MFSNSDEKKNKIVYTGTEFVLSSDWEDGWNKDWTNEWEDMWHDFEKEIEKKNKKCKHEWKPTHLIVSTVYDCIKCGAKKEEE